MRRAVDEVDSKCLEDGRKQEVSDRRTGGGAQVHGSLGGYLCVVN